MEDAAKDNYLNAKRTVTTAHSESNLEQAQERKDEIAKRRREEADRDNKDLAYVNASEMLPSEALRRTMM